MQENTYQVGFVMSKEHSIYYRCYSPKNSCGNLLLLHGYAEHSGRYEHVIELVLQNNLTVYSLDLQGHGRSQGDRGYIASFDNYIDDFFRIIDLIKENGEEKKLFIVAHSMGALVSLLAVSKHDIKVDGLVLSSPLLGFSLPLSKIKLLIAKLIYHFFPRLNFKSSVSGNILSHDQKMANAYDTDKFIFKKATIGWYFAAQKAIEEAFLLAPNFTMPLFMQLAGDDRIVDSNASLNWFSQLPKGNSNKSYKVYQNLYHEIYNESERDLVLKDMIDWLLLQARA